MPKIRKRIDIKQQTNYTFTKMFNKVIYKSYFIKRYLKRRIFREEMRWKK